MGKWHPFNTMKEHAPKGDHFLIFSRGGRRIGEMFIQSGQIALARYIPDNKEGWKLETDWHFTGQPTDWMPIEPPTPE